MAASVDEWPLKAVGTAGWGVECPVCFFLNHFVLCNFLPKDTL